MNKRAFLFLVLALTWTTATSQIPSKVSYQGLLTNNAGQPVADGNYDLQFDLYNAALLGTLRHSETHASVEVLRGTFNVILGSSSPLPAIFSEQLFVEITVLAGPGVGSALTFSPRTELTSAPYSLAPWIPSGANISFSGGNVGIGTSIPVDLLTVGSASNRGTIGVVGSVPPAITLRDTRSGGGHWTFYTGVDEIGDINLYDQTLGTPQYALTVKKGTNRVGLGTSTPAEKLDVVGTIQSTGFKLPTGASSGYVLTSDAMGVASWQPAPSSGGNINGSGTANFLSKFTGTNTIGNSAVFESGGNVVIGTTTPDANAKLSVNGYTFSKAPVVVYDAAAGSGIAFDIAWLNDVRVDNNLVEKHSNNYEFTLKKAGWYKISYFVYFVDLASTWYTAEIHKNGTALKTLGTWYGTFTEWQTSGTIVISSNGNDVIKLRTGSYVADSYFPAAFNSHQISFEYLGAN
jgi:hypothetical protein